MAIKKNELYSSLWASCDKLRGGMDASQYKDYILTLLFVKYVTDKFKGVIYADITVPEGGSFDDMVALKGKNNIGEGIDIIIEKLAEANNLRGVIDNAHFNDESKLGKGQEMVDKLTGLVGIFERPEFNFKNNKASGDDILGITPRNEGYSVYDPACGSGSLLIRAANEAPFEISIWGQEKETTTAGLAKMNLVLHNKAAGEIKSGNTFSDPQYFEDGSNNDVLKRFDFAVVNPPFSLKNWTDGLKEFGRFDGYGDRPPEKNGDFAWLMHILKSLKSTGKAAVILPHGVLFRGNAEATIRKAIIDKGYIKGIIGLPANLFYGTGIPACILVIDKSYADERKGIFMIDASHDYIKDGNKNRLRERDIYKIVTTFNEQITDDPKYARFVENDEIKGKNDYNLNIPRYIDSSIPEDEQDINAHLHGGIPAVDVDSMSRYWSLFPNLKTKLFSPLREGYYRLNVEKDKVRDIVYNDEEFSAYADQIDNAFADWQQAVDADLRGIDETVDVKQFIVDLAKKLIDRYEHIELVDPYDVYEVLLSYWQTTMSDDVFLLKYDGYEAGREIEYDIEVKEKKKGNTTEKKEVIRGWDGKLIPKAIIERVYFLTERAKIDEAQRIAEETQSRLDELVEEQTGDEGYLREYLNDKEKLDDKQIAARLKKLKTEHPDSEEYQILCNYSNLSKTLKDQNKIVKDLYAALDAEIKDLYPLLTVDEVKDLLVNRKWYYTVFDGIKALYAATSHRMASRVTELAERYENTLPELEATVSDYEAKVRKHLERMGFTW